MPGPGGEPNPEAAREHETQVIEHEARTLYEFLTTPQDNLTNYRADGLVVIVPGNAFYSSAEYAAQLYLDGKAPVIVMSGGSERNQRWLKPEDHARKRAELDPLVDDLNADIVGQNLTDSQGNPATFEWLRDWKPTEADIFAWKAMDMGVPDDKIIREPIASNTAENYHFSLKALQKYYEERHEPMPAKVIIVTYIEEARRNYYTARKVLEPEGIEFKITSPKRDFEREFSQNPEKKTLNLIASIYRMYTYGELGKGDIAGGTEFPPEVLTAIDALHSLGLRPEDRAGFENLRKDMEAYVGGDFDLQKLRELHRETSPGEY